MKREIKFRAWDGENMVNCPEDCIGEGKSTFATVNDFCESRVEDYCEFIDYRNSELCSLCIDLECAGEGEDVFDFVEKGPTFCCEGLELIPCTGVCTPSVLGYCQ